MNISCDGIYKEGHTTHENSYVWFWKCFRVAVLT